MPITTLNTLLILSGGFVVPDLLKLTWKLFMKKALIKDKDTEDAFDSPDSAILAFHNDKAHYTSVARVSICRFLEQFLLPFFFINGNTKLIYLCRI